MRRAYAFEGFDDDHAAAATRASGRRRRCFGLAVGLSVALWGETLGGGDQLAAALDVARSNRSSEQAVVADAMETAGQHMQEKAADELGGVERHGLEPIAAFDPVVLTWGASGQGGDSFMRPPAHLVGSVRLFGLCQRRSIFRRWLLAAKMASARRGSRMRSTGEAGVRGAHVLDARLALAETCRQE